jgi:hypothetical protein
VFDRGGRHWDHAGTIRLPASLRFEDYSSLAVAGDRVVVVVSDRAKREGQDQRCRAKDQSIHVFAIPDLG